MPTPMTRPLPTPMPHSTPMRTPSSAPAPAPAQRILPLAAIWISTLFVTLAVAAVIAPQRGGERWVDAGTRVGKVLPALQVVDLDGKGSPLAEAWAANPVVFVTASLTCPVARGTCADLPALQEAIGSTAKVVLVYTTEAHPTNGASPYRPNDGPWVTKDNERDGILRDQPRTLQERLVLARELRERTGTALPIVVDLPSNEAWTALGGGPNMAVLVDTSGTVRLKQGWIDPKTLADAVKKELTMNSQERDSLAADAPRRYSASGHDITPFSKERVAELAKKLSPEAFKVTQRAGTEPPGSCGVMLDNKKDGTYCCVVCGLPLFASPQKFHSGTGWPSFFAPVDAKHVAYHRDATHGMERVEITCARCDSHLGHVFEDGPRDTTGLRYCLNGVALEFHAKEDPMPAESRPVITPEVAYFAGGCFWGVEHMFEKCPGVLDAESGYMNGLTENPTYQDVCGKKTGHAEAVKVVFDPSRVTYRQLLEGFFIMHNPTELNRQGPDVGDQYRSAVFTTSEKQIAEAKALIAELTAVRRFGKPIVTVVEPAKTFYKAEQYHQDYVERTGRACHAVNPWPQVFGAAAAR